MTRLLAEMSTLKSQNEQLKNELQSIKREFELMRVEMKEGDDESINKIEDLIEDVYHAEKTKQEVMRKMIVAADEDRDAALGELDRMRLKTLSRMDPFLLKRSAPLDTLDHDEDDGIDISGSSLNDSGNHFDSVGLGGVDDEKSIQHMEQMLSKQRELMKREIQFVIDQRDSARSQVEKLEKKVSSLEFSSLNSQSDLRTKAKLKVVEQERDMVIAKLKFLMQDVNEAAILSNLQKALLLDEPSPNLNTSHLDKNVESGKSNLSAQLLRQKEETEKLELKLAEKEKESLTQNDRIQSLEKIVTRQRQKLNTLCAGPLLMEDNE